MFCYYFIFSPSPYKFKVIEVNRGGGYEIPSEELKRFAYASLANLMDSSYSAIESAITGNGQSFSDFTVDCLDLDDGDDLAEYNTRKTNKDNALFLNGDGGYDSEGDWGTDIASYKSDLGL